MKLTIHCYTCKENYEIEKPKTRPQLLLVLDFAVCPHCKTKRMPNLWNMLVGDWRCSDCGIGAPFVDRKSSGIDQCTHCYNVRYWAARLQKTDYGKINQ